MKSRSGLTERADEVYTAKRNDVTYTYRVSWMWAGEALIWNASVRTGDGTLAGTPSGQILNTKGLEARLEQLIKAEVESAIENRLGVE